MDIPQSGREAFEAWARTQTNRIDALNRKGDGYVITTAQIMWLAWQAALAQQGREVGDAVAWLVDAPRWQKKAYVKRHAAYVKAAELSDRKATVMPLYTAAPKQQAVEWRPIEIAPRDTELLVYNERTKRTVVGFVYEFTEATHWMPLPALPGKTELDRG